ncbi:MAG: ketoacyl-ACP synthase III [Magnetococcales bacterium]|nr:ketoacyl-ACP synthase III [Magnetococcales bacterium]
MTHYRARIIGSGSYLPERRLHNDELAGRLDTSDEWIFSRTGIRERRIAAADQFTSDLATAAARQALAAASVAPDQIDLILVATSTPDLIFPATATQVQYKLGCHRGRAPAFDLQAVCTGFIYALSVAEKFIQSGSCRHALVIGAETFSRAVDWTDRTTCILFGDGAGAVVLRAEPITAAHHHPPGILSTHLHADGSYIDLLKGSGGYSQRAMPVLGLDQETNVAGVQMRGNEVFKQAVKALDEIVDETLVANQLTRTDVDWLVPHQANIRIIQSTAKRLGMEMDRVVVTVDRHGNTSAASVPLALDEAVRDGRIQPGHLVLMEAFGSGFTWGSALVRW